MTPVTSRMHAPCTGYSCRPATASALRSPAVSTVIPRRLVDVIDVSLAVRTFSSGVSQSLRTCTVEPWGVRLTAVTPDDPLVAAEHAWLVPEQGLRVRRRYLVGGDAGEPPAIEIDAVRSEWDGRRWRSADLLLGILLRAGRPARVVRSEEFADALQGGVLTPADGDEAMATVHRVLGELVDHRHDPERWLAALGLPVMEPTA